jgi:hypothetical protein
MVLSGNPVRQDLLGIESKREAIQYFNLNESSLTGS